MGFVCKCNVCRLLRTRIEEFALLIPFEIESFDLSRYNFKAWLSWKRSKLYYIDRPSNFRKQKEFRCKEKEFSRDLTLRERLFDPMVSMSS